MSDQPHVPDDESIPLCEPSSAATPIVHESSDMSSADRNRAIRGKRHNPRRPMENVHICFSLHDASGRLDHIECPLVDVSREGVAVICDRRTPVGMRCYVSYRTVSQQPVHVGGVVKNCAKFGVSRYRIGVLLDRHLQQEEQRPAKRRIGRSVSPTHQCRRLRDAECDDDGNIFADEDTFRPVVHEPSLGDGPDDYELTPE